MRWPININHIGFILKNQQASDTGLIREHVRNSYNSATQKPKGL